MKKFTPLFCFFMLMTALGQQIKFKKLTTDDGLSNNSVTDIISDAEGGLWVATWDGLNYYDGFHFKVFKHEQGNPESLSGNLIIRLERDVAGRIWILTDKSLNLYLGNGAFKNFDLSVVPDDLFLSKRQNLVVKIDQDYKEYVDGDFVPAVKQDIPENDEASLSSILLTKYPEIIINDVLKDSHGNLWFATRRNGLYVIPGTPSNLNNDVIDHYTYDLYSPYSFNSNEIEKLYQDDFGNVWLGHKDGGLSMAYRGSEHITTIVPHPVKFPHLPNETIRAITMGSDNKIWLGYYTQGLYYFSSETNCYLKYDLQEAALDTDWERIRSLYTDASGDIWVGTYAGLIRISPKGYKLYRTKDYAFFPNARNYSIQEDGHGYLWVGCWGGLAKFNLKTENFETFKGQDELLPYHIRKVVVAENELIMATENNGVLLLNLSTGTVESINTEKGILGNSVYAVHKDFTTGQYWIATLGGITVYDREKGVVRNISEKDGLPSHMVYSLALNNNHFWVSTTKGIAAINKQTYQVAALNPKEGWQAAEFSEGASFQDKKGMLFFGGINGLSYFHPDKMDFWGSLPKIKLIADNRELSTKELTKSYSENSLKLEIIPIAFQENSNNKVLYKLEGYDKDWRIFEDHAVIQYKDLPSGHYQFWVKSTLDQEGTTSPNLLVIIQKPFYETGWFLGLAGIVIIGSTLFIIVRKNKNALAYQKKLEAQIEARTKLINEQKEHLEKANLALDDKNKEILKQKEKLLNLHNNLKNRDFEIDKFKTFVLSEFREPISKITESLYEIDGNPDLKNKLLRASGKLINLVSEWDYLDHVNNIGNQKKSAVFLGPLFKNLLGNLQTDLSREHIHLDYKIETGNAWVEMDLLRFKLLFQYLFSDVLKYSEPESHLGVKCILEKELLVLQIESDSSILKNNFENIKNYSPYFKAVATLLNDLDSKFKVLNDSIIDLTVKIPIRKLELDESRVEEVRWKHLVLDETLPEDKNYILVFCDETDIAASRQVLEDDSYHLIFESDEGALTSAIRHISLDTLVVYNMPFTNKLITLLNDLKKEGKVTIPVLYISEKINYALQEQSEEAGIDAVIQLPASPDFIRKKISKFIGVFQDAQKTRPLSGFYDFISEEKEMLSPHEKLVKRALEIIKKELTNPSFNVEALIDTLEISRIKCYRIFKEILKQSPSDVIISLRLQKAEFLLKNKNLNISEISFECGFNDPKYFSRMFRKHFGSSPRTFKDHLQHVSH